MTDKNTIYVSVDSPNLGFPYFKGGTSDKNHPIGLEAASQNKGLQTELHSTF